MLAIIGGSGLARLPGLETLREEAVRTPWGEPSSPLAFGALDGTELVFLARHGHDHTIAPHRINYRANVWALRHCGAQGVLAVATVGGIRGDLGPGTLVLPDQIIDYTSGRAATFFESPDQPVTHVDFTHPYDERIRGLIARAAADLGEPLVQGATYGCVQGPRLETAAEIRRMARDGCDLVGMTAMPEAALAREMQLPYAMLSVVANHAAGTGESSQGISLEAIGATLEIAMARALRVLARCVRLAADESG